MSRSIHHIRLLAGLEIRPPAASVRRTLDRNAAGELADCLADDLAVHIDEVTGARLVMAGSLLEPGELLRPGFPAWTALEELSRAGSEFRPEKLAIGSHRGRMPRPALQAPETPPAGLFVCVPMLLAAPAELGHRLESLAEQHLFERAGLRPPALSAIHQSTGFEPVHGQLMTATDLLALVRMQLAGAGLDPFWPPVEHALLAPESASGFDLPAGLEARWEPDPARLYIGFVTFDQAGREPADYALWLRAFRQLTALLDEHRVCWEVQSRGAAAVDRQGGWISEAAGTGAGADRLVRQHHPGVGLVAFSCLVDGQLNHYYPLQARAVAELETQLGRHDFEQTKTTDDLCYDASRMKLTVEP